jgi:hypothetical protein
MMTEIGALHATAKAPMLPKDIETRQKKSYLEGRQPLNHTIIIYQPINNAPGKAPCNASMKTLSPLQ